MKSEGESHLKSGVIEVFHEWNFKDVSSNDGEETPVLSASKFTHFKSFKRHQKASIFNKITGNAARSL